MNLDFRINNKFVNFLSILPRICTMKLFYETYMTMIYVKISYVIGHFSADNDLFKCFYDAKSCKWMSSIAYNPLKTCAYTPIPPPTQQHDLKWPVVHATSSWVICIIESVSQFRRTIFEQSCSFSNTAEAPMVLTLIDRVNTQCQLLPLCTQQCQSPSKK